MFNVLINQNKIFTYVLLLLAAATTWLVFNMLQNPIAEPSKPHHPDSFMLNAVAIRMNKLDGKPQDKLQAPKLVHYPEGDTTDITEPNFIIFNSASEPWKIYANTGQAQQGIDILLLWGNVRLIQDPGPNNSALKITTSAMTIFPHEQQAQTDQPVTLWQPAGTVDAVGLKADMKTGAINLLSKARGQYKEPVSQ